MNTRASRAVITFLTLVVCLWVMGRIRIPSMTSGANAQVGSRAAEVPVQPMALDSLPPVPIRTLPLAALDNNCTSTSTVDISSCTGYLSGGPAREYRFAISAVRSLFGRTIVQGVGVTGVGSFIWPPEGR